MIVKGFFNGGIRYSVSGIEIKHIFSTEINRFF